MSDFTESKEVLTHLIIKDWKDGRLKTTYDLQKAIKESAEVFFSPENAKEVFQDVKQSVFAEMRKGA